MISGPVVLFASTALVVMAVACQSAPPAAVGRSRGRPVTATGAMPTGASDLGARPSAEALARPLGDGSSSLNARLCGGRAPCGVKRRRPIGGTPSLELVDLGVPVTSSGDVCEGSEYWLVEAAGASPSESSGTHLIARDCNEQTSADGLAHASTTVEGEALVLAYEQLQSSDLCAGMTARLALRPFHLTSETRYDGTFQTGGQRGCRHDNELHVDWRSSTHWGRWSRAACGEGASPSAEPRLGLVVPRFTGDAPLPGVKVGGCGASLTGDGARRWMEAAAIDRSVRLRAMVVNDRLWIAIDGGDTGTLTVMTAAASAGDGALGAVGCAADVDRPVSTARLDFSARRSDGRAGGLQVLAREGTSTHVVLDGMSAVGRVAISFRNKRGQGLDTARFPSRRATAFDLPMVRTFGPAEAFCVASQQGLDVRADNVPTSGLSLP